VLDRDVLRTSPLPELLCCGLRNGWTSTDRRDVPNRTSDHKRTTHIPPALFLCSLAQPSMDASTCSRQYLGGPPSGDSTNFNMAVTDSTTFNKHPCQIWASSPSLTACLLPGMPRPSRTCASGWRGRSALPSEFRTRSSSAGDQSERHDEAWFRIGPGTVFGPLIHGRQWVGDGGRFLAAAVELSKHLKTM